MLFRLAPGAVVAGFLLVGGCSSPLDLPPMPSRVAQKSLPSDPAAIPLPGSVPDDGSDAPTLGGDAEPDDYVRCAILRSPSVGAAYQRWLAAAERLPQARALPDPRLGFGFFLDEVETRTGAQQARVGISQAFPWPGVLAGREDAAALEARAAWRELEGVRLAVTERVVEALHEVAYLDAAVRITEENLALLRSFEEVVRARYRVGVGSHPALTRVQVELGQLEDRLASLRSMRPSLVADLNRSLDRAANAPVPTMGRLPGLVATGDAESLATAALRSNPSLLAMEERIEAERVRSDVARLEGRPAFTVGVDYIMTDEAMNSTIPESGDDPILLNFGITLPVWREKYDAGVREALARRLAVTHDRADEARRIVAAIERAWFEHTDADRRVRLYEQTLIPKAEESLRASLAGFRAGESAFLDLLDTERTLLEFALSSERARADRGRALARLGRLVGSSVPATDEYEIGGTR